MKGLSKLLTTLCFGSLLLSGCATEHPVITFRPIIDEDVQVIKAGGFGFEPNDFIARLDDTTLFIVENTSGSPHNFSVKDPLGRTIMEVDVPAKEHAKVRVTFNEPGTYTFYCNKSFHSMVGMSGKIKVTGTMISENIRQAR